MVLFWHHGQNHASIVPKNSSLIAVVGRELAAF